MKNWLRRRREMRRLKRQWLREWKGRTVVMSTQMATDYDPPSASLKPASPWVGQTPPGGTTNVPESGE